jgi:isocitrate dehydrogenase
MKNTEGAFRDWGYKLAQSKFRAQVVTERESWILGNKDKDAAMTVEANAKSIDPGYDMMVPAQQKALRDEVEGVIKNVRLSFGHASGSRALTHPAPSAQLHGSHGGGKYKKMLQIKDSIADITLQQVLTRPKEFDVIGA